MARIVSKIRLSLSVMVLLEHTYVDTLLCDLDTENVNDLSFLMADRVLWKKLSKRPSLSPVLEHAEGTYEG